MTAPLVCDHCGQADETTKFRRLTPDVENAYLCADCWLDVQGGKQKERQAP